MCVLFASFLQLLTLSSYFSLDNPEDGKSPRRDLNSRPLVYKTSALTPELRRRRQLTNRNRSTFIIKHSNIFFLHVYWCQKKKKTHTHTERINREKWKRNAKEHNTHKPFFLCNALQCHPITQNTIISRLKDFQVPWPGFEPGLLRPQRNVLTTIRSRRCVHIGPILESPFCIFFFFLIQSTQQHTFFPFVRTPCSSSTVG